MTRMFEVGDEEHGGAPLLPDPAAGKETPIVDRRSSMGTDLLDLYDRASSWATEKVAGATEKLDARTPCDDWDVRTLLDHILETQRYFLSSARGEDASPPSPTPPATLSDDPAADFERVRGDMLAASGAEEVPLGLEDVIEQRAHIPVVARRLVVEHLRGAGDLLGGP